MWILFWGASLDFVFEWVEFAGKSAVSVPDATT
jgi:hypothetical protein